MFRFAALLILASAYFSPAHALTVDLWQQAERDVLTLVNQDRTALGLGTLTGDSRLHDAAIAHSTDMAVNNFFDHTGSDGSNAGQRAQAAGYDWTAWGENIAAGYTMAQSVFDGWLASPGHRDNMRNAIFTDIGIGLVPGTAETDFATYWTMVMAAGDSETGEPVVVLLPPFAGLQDPGAPIQAPLIQDPNIQVSQVPLPPSFWLFAFALAAGLLFQRRRGPKA
jgi:Cysteine-rich secretory protein family